MNDDQLRIGDAERERAAADLGDHYAAGRLSAEEHTERLDRIWAARTRADLAPVFRDLPAPYADHGGPRRTPPRTRPWMPLPVLVVLAILLACTVLTHLPFLLIGLVVLVCWAARRHRHGYHAG